MPYSLLLVSDDQNNLKTKYLRLNLYCFSIVWAFPNITICDIKQSVQGVVIVLSNIDKKDILKHLVFKGLP